MDTTIVKRPWTEAEILVINQEVAKASNAKEGLEIAAKILNRSFATTSSKYYSLQKKTSSKKSEKPAKPKPDPTTAKLSTGYQLMAQVLSSDVRASEIILRPTEMIIKFG